MAVGVGLLQRLAAEQPLYNEHNERLEKAADVGDGDQEQRNAERAVHHGEHLTYGGGGRHVPVA